MKKRSSKICGDDISKTDALAVQIEDLEIRYDGSNRRALNGLNLKIARGSYFGLLGPNGAGKTTLISFLCGQLQGDFKTAKILGQTPKEMQSLKTKIGYSPQEIALYPSLSAQENLHFFARLFDLPVSEGERVLQWVGLQDRKHDRVCEFSGGMKRRLNLAVALLNNPELLILDEPTVGVDPQSRNFIFDRILELKKSGVTLIYSTHYLEEVEKLCDTVGIIRDGRMLKSGPLHEILGQGNLEARFLDLTGRDVE